MRIGWRGLASLVTARLKEADSLRTQSQTTKDNAISHRRLVDSAVTVPSIDCTAREIIASCVRLAFHCISRGTVPE